MHATGWSRGLEVTGGGSGVVSHAGLVLLRQLADRTGLTSGLSAALPSPLGGHDRGRVFADLACAIADGARVISDFRVMGDHRELLGPVASVPTAWRALKEIAAGGDRRRRKVTAAAGKARRRARPHELDRLASRHGYQVTYSVGWELAARERTAIAVVPEHAWQAAIDGRGEVREHRADGACADPRCAHRACWIEEAHVAELTGLLREGPAGDQLNGRPKAMRVFARRERPHPGAQLSLFEAADGWRYSLHVTNLPATTRGWPGQCACIDAAHRVHARVEDVIRTGKDTGPGHFPSHDHGLNKAWLDASMIACILLKDRQGP